MIAPIIRKHEILIVDVTLLDQMEPDGALLQANDAAEALVVIAEHDDLDVVIFDLLIPGMDGLRAIAEYVRNYP